MPESSPEFRTEIESVPNTWQSRILTVLLLICFALSGWLWTQSPRQNQTVAVAAELAPHRTVRENETKNIEDVRLGQRVVGRNPLREQTQLPSDIRPETHRAVRLEMIQHEALYELSFVRSLTWLQEQNAQADKSIPFVLEEMGLNALTRVISIDPCPEIEPDDGTGRMVVTGTMKHLAGNVLEIETADDTEPLGVTDTHPIWSVDRQDFVVAGQLEVGESLEQADGTVTRITRITPTRGPPVIVYNLEIDGEHVFRVGEDGVLVHNACSSTSGETSAAARGRQKHKDYDPGPQYDTKMTLDNGKRPDAVDLANRIIRELKPHVARAIKKGWKQLEGYVKELERMYPETKGLWQAFVDTYIP